MDTIEIISLLDNAIDNAAAGTITSETMARVEAGMIEISNRAKTLSPSKIEQIGDRYQLLRSLMA